ncbi:hypothetical protein KEM55_003666 [Ascosphaera atra]|nr:hypothetical protein KEM55_003666 [Ascosphaera atra]
MKFLSVFAGALPALLSLTNAHLLHLDDGTHSQMSSAWRWPDPIAMREYMMEFGCPSKTVYTRFRINDTSRPYAMAIGVPDIDTIYDYRPNVWVIGEHLVKPDGYKPDPSADKNPIPPPQVPAGWNAVEYSSMGSDYWYNATHTHTSFTFMRWNVTVDQPGDVFVAVQPTEHRIARAWLVLGNKHKHMKEKGLIDKDTLHQFYSPWPRMGKTCEPWSN